MSKLDLSLTCGDYDRTQAILDGRVTIDGCRTIAHRLPPEESFFRAFGHAEFDVAELSLSTYVLQTEAGRCPYLAVPVFLSRSFRHSALYVRTASPLTRPEELRGLRVGVPEYQVTAAVWVRAFLHEDHGVAPSDVRWVTGGVENPGRHEKSAIALPPEISLEAAPATETLGAMLLDGRIDALLCPRAPSSYRPGGDGPVRRLLADPRAAAEAYFGRHGIFPIMHVVGVRRDLAERHPWLPGSVMKAFAAAKRHALEALEDIVALATSLPWSVEEFERTRAVMGPDFWPYGFAANRATLESFLHHHARQGLSAGRLRPEDLFAPSTIAGTFKI